MKGRIMGIKIFSIGAVLAAFLFLCSTVVMAEAPKLQHEEMLYPTVLVTTGGRGSGSGTVIYSEMNGGEWESYVLTNHHVVNSAITIKKIFDPQEGETKEVEMRRPVKIDIYEYNDYSTAIGTTGRTGNIVAYDKLRDLALIQIDDKERPVKFVGKLYPENADGPWIFQETFAVGSGLGAPPFPTVGLLSGYGKDKDGRALYLTSSPIIFGNSGGSLWVKNKRGYELIGVPSMVSGYGWGSVVSHMGWSRPISEIRIFFRENDFGFILGDKVEELSGSVDE